MTMCSSCLSVHKIRIALFLMLLGICLPTAGPVAAGEGEARLPDITVEGRAIEERLSAELAEYGHKVEIIAGEDIRLGGYTDVNQVLESLVPGLYAASKSGRGDYMRISLNGGDTKRVIFLIDGVRINNRLYGRGYLDTLSVGMIERIEVLRNGEGLFYGTDGTSGAINIITKQVATQRRGSVGVGYGSHEAVEAHGMVSDTVDKNGFLFYASHDGWEGYLPFRGADYDRIDGSVRKDRGYDRTNMMGKYRRAFDLGQGATLNASLLRTSADADYMRVNEDRAVNDRTEYVGILKWTHDVTEEFSYYIKSYYHEWWTDYTRQALDGSFIYNEALWGYEDWGFNIMGSWFFHGQNELLLGLDYQNYWGKDEVVTIDTDNEEVYAGFFAVRPHFDALPDLKTSLGGRYNDTGGNEKFVWNLSAYSPLPGPFFARGAVGTNFRLANANELYVDESYAIGNTGLKPEESFNIEVGLGADLGFFTAEVGYYYSEITDMIAVGDNLVYTNTDGETEMETVEFQVYTQPVNGISASVSACYTEAENKGTHTQLTHIPEYFYKGLLRYRHDSNRFGGDITGRYIGDVYGNNYPGFGRRDYGHHFICDLSLFYKFGKDLAHMFTLRVDNIFDREHVSYGYGSATGSDGQAFIYEYLGTPLSAMVGYTYTF